MSELSATEVNRGAASTSGRKAARGWSPQRSRTIRAYRRLSTVLGIALAIALAATGYFWLVSAQLQQQQDATRGDLRVALQAWNQAGMAARSTSGFADQSDARRMRFVADTLLPLQHPYLMTVVFGVSNDATGAVGVDAAVRVVNSGTTPLEPRVRLEFHDYLGNKIGEVDLDARQAVDGDGATTLQPDEMRLYRTRVPLDAGAPPAWFATRWAPN